VDVFEAIHTRRSVRKFKPDPVEEEKIANILEAATWAPNHSLTQPWRFFVLTGEGRRPLGRLFRELRRREMADPDTLENQEILRREEEKPFKAPVVVVVAMEPKDEPGILPQEERSAVSAAVQNMLLAAHALGLGAKWKTGKRAYHPYVARFFGLSDRAEIIAFIDIGYPREIPAPPPRDPYTVYTKWISEDLPYDRVPPLARKEELPDAAEELGEGRLENSIRATVLGKGIGQINGEEEQE